MFSENEFKIMKESAFLINCARGGIINEIALLDALRATSKPKIEVHISNIHAREEFRSKSLISKNVKGIICGFGLKSYDLAIDSIIYK